MSPRTIPCRMCQAGPGELCKYKHVQIPPGTILGGHDRRTPKSYRCYHDKRVADAQHVREGTSAAQPVARSTAGCRWRA